MCNMTLNHFLDIALRTTTVKSTPGLIPFDASFANVTSYVFEVHGALALFRTVFEKSHLKIGRILPQWDPDIEL